MARSYNNDGGGQQKIAPPAVAGLIKLAMNAAELNAMNEPEFRDALDGLWEHSPWVVDAAAAARPFDTRGDLSIAMWNAVLRAPLERRLALLRAHPDLAGKLARAGALTDDSAKEQSSLGLDRLDDLEFEAFTSMNAAYRERFGFPFIICVRDNTKASIRSAFERRLSHAADAELQIALDEVRKIAEYRLRDRMES